MYPLIPQSFQEAITLAATNLLNEVAVFLPKLAAALVVLILGAALARWIKKVCCEGTSTLKTFQRITIYSS